MSEALERIQAAAKRTGGYSRSVIADDLREVVARVAKLETALKHSRGVIMNIMSDGNCDCRKDFAIIDAALSETAT